MVHTEISTKAPPHKIGSFPLAEIGLLLFCLLLFFWRLGSVPLFDLDEGLYVACARQMVLHGDWITPRLNSHPPLNPAASTTPFFEKPILIYWLGALSMRLFGLTPFAARLPSALASLLTTLLVWWFAKITFGRRAAALAALTYMLAPLTLLDARQLTTDALLTFWFTTMMLSAYLCLEPPSSITPKTRFGLAMVFWVSLAFSVLTKGAAGALPLFVLAIFLLLKRLTLRIKARGGFRFYLSSQFESPHTLLTAWRCLCPLLGILLCFAIAAPWHYLIWKAGGRDELGHTWFQEYILRQHLGRFRGLDKVHDMPLPTYFVFFLIGFFPWACFAPAAFSIHDLWAPYRRHERFLIVWFWAVFVLFSLASAKLPSYIAPLYPAAAILTGRWFDIGFAYPNASFAKTLRRGASAAFITTFVLFIVAFLGPHFVPRNAPIAPPIATLARQLTALWMIGALLALLCFRKQAYRLGITALALTTTLMVLLGYTVGYQDAARYVQDPYQQLAKDANKDAILGIPIVYYHIIPRRPSMLFYANYSPYEHKELPLLPWLTKMVPLNKGWVDVITSADTWQHHLQPELQQYKIPVHILKWRGGPPGGWLLLQLHIVASKMGKVREGKGSDSVLTGV
ncbi:ArnT family glycosyltransferase [Chthonomonas calidirosea]|uniref:ArnT family glycosyltransferase n=1 Tax=Chthonomonas calidirosea TaxID=454171 RepID=UPI0006EC7C48|nr:glycosyltransferase family 39 protein [Chthonomonas calidirosea]CEK13237.1 PMT family glycosyltransferase, 4-amino-4-deoxy-L-arabinose transferase [Chthonomonas calidirosea]